LQVGENSMANKDGFRLERIRVGTQEKVASFEIVRKWNSNFGRNTYERIVLYKNIFI
jgi:hypothetical protein